MKKMSGKGKTRQATIQKGGSPKPKVTAPVPVGYPVKMGSGGKKKYLEDMK